jgi:hypothetical protein
MGECRYSSIILETSVLGGDKLSDSRSDQFIVGKTPPNNRCIGGWVGRWGSHSEEGKILSLPGNRTRAVQPVAIPAELSRRCEYMN